MNIEDLRQKQGHFESKRQDTQTYYKELENLRLRFIKKYSTETLNKLKIENYVEGKIVNGKTDEDTFCYWVEWKTTQLGRMQGARADKFGIYVDKETQSYRYLKKFKNETDAFFTIKNNILNLIDAGLRNELQRIKDIELSPMFKGKILFLYYPTSYINIFSETHVNHFLKEIGVYEDYKFSDLVDKRKVLMDIKDNDVIMNTWNMYEYSDFLYSEFGRPIKKESIPVHLLDYIDDDEYSDPEKVNIEYVDLQINSEIKNNDHSQLHTSSNHIIDFEKENRRKLKIGTHGELIVFYAEKKFLAQNGRHDLSERVEHTAKKDSSSGFDILSYELNGDEKYIEVKSTNNSILNKITFNISSNEVKKSKEYNNYYLYFVFEVKSNNPKIWKLHHPLKYESKGLELKPLSYHGTIIVR